METIIIECREDRCEGGQVSVWYCSAGSSSMCCGGCVKDKDCGRCGGTGEEEIDADELRDSDVVVRR